MPTPAPIAPWTRPGGAGGGPTGRRIVARAAPRVATADSRRSHPGAGPKAVPLDRLVGIGRAGRQVSALPANQARERELVETDQRVGGSARREDERAHGAG